MSVSSARFQRHLRGFFFSFTLSSFIFKWLFKGPAILKKFSQPNLVEATAKLSPKRPTIQTPLHAINLHFSRPPPIFDNELHCFTLKTTHSKWNGGKRHTHKDNFSIIMNCFTPELLEIHLHFGSRTKRFGERRKSLYESRIFAT